MSKPKASQITTEVLSDNGPRLCTFVKECRFIQESGMVNIEETLAVITGNTIKRTIPGTVYDLLIATTKKGVTENENFTYVEIPLRERAAGKLNPDLGEQLAVVSEEQGKPVDRAFNTYCLQGSCRGICRPEHIQVSGVDVIATNRPSLPLK